MVVYIGCRFPRVTVDSIVDYSLDFVCLELITKEGELVFPPEHNHSSIVAILPEFKVHWNNNTMLTKSITEYIDWLNHITLSAVLIPRTITSQLLPKYARIIASTIKPISYLQYWMSILSHDETGWNRWNHMRNLCETPDCLFLDLHLESEQLQYNMQNRWLGEPIRCVTLHPSAFDMIIEYNKDPKLVLKHQHFRFIFRLLNTLPNMQIVILTYENMDISLHVECVKDVIDFTLSCMSGSSQVKIEQPYWDYLQVPLQPLTQNLSNQTYAVFEKDPIKYKMYKKALCAAMNKYATTKNCMVLVVGAGRGPLVDMTLAAAAETKRKVDVFVVEKNPNAMVTLEINNKMCWNKKVKLFCADIRSFESDLKVDIIVSELLGSFGDNELSPECIDGARKFLNTNGTMIPCTSVSYIAPISTNKLWSQLRDKNKLEVFETSYVCKLQNFYEISEPVDCFHFSYDLNDYDAKLSPDNNRYTEFKFQVKQSSMMHGFIGYFESTLFKNDSTDIMISILPTTHSDGMFSWFPIYFPLKTPIFVEKDTVISGCFWRVCSNTAVWYEWCVNSPTNSHIHNIGGRSSSIKL